ncbi:MAG TPA: hypothetical protein VN712_09555 [Dermatophilaceae bacterium]|nr:hypothetical protein [Dermatophilaceae bacterium]
MRIALGLILDAALIRLLAVIGRRDIGEARASLGWPAVTALGSRGLA